MARCMLKSRGHRYRAPMSQPELSGDPEDRRNPLPSSHALQTLYEPVWDPESENPFESHFCSHHQVT